MLVVGEGGRERAIAHTDQIDLRRDLHPVMPGAPDIRQGAAATGQRDGADLVVEIEEERTHVPRDPIARRAAKAELILDRLAFLQVLRDHRSAARRDRLGENFGAVRLRNVSVKLDFVRDLIRQAETEERHELVILFIGQRCSRGGLVEVQVLLYALPDVLDPNSGNDREPPEMETILDEQRQIKDRRGRCRCAACRRDRWPSSRDDLREANRCDKPAPRPRWYGSRPRARNHAAAEPRDRRCRTSDARRWSNSPGAQSATCRIRRRVAAN